MAVGAGVIAAVRAAGTAFFTSVREFHFTRGGGDPDRLDAFLAHQKPRHGKRVVKTWIDEGLVQLVRAGGRPELTSNPAERLHDGDRVRVRFEVEAMGFGDVKLQGGIGAFVGPEGSLLVLALASFGGAVIGSLNIARIFAILRVRSSRRRRTNANQPWRVARAAGGTVPFGPFLAGGAVVLVLARGPILTLLENMLFRRPG
jgi:prepilin signal peptidase PulO-like enzyme (type II secretory pathway)